MLTRHSQWLAAGGDHPNPLGALNDFAHELGRREEQVLAVVNH